MGVEDIGKKIEDVKAKIDTALEKTDIDEKIKANSKDKEVVGKFKDGKDKDHA